MENDLLERIGTRGEEETIEARLRRHLAPVQAERDQLVAEREDERQKLALYDREIAALDRVLQAALGPQKKKAARATQRAPKVTAEIAATVEMVLAAEGPVTSIDVAAALGIERNAASERLRRARDLELLRRAGTRENEGGGRDHNLYGPLPDTREKLERMLNG